MRLARWRSPLTYLAIAAFCAAVVVVHAADSHAARANRSAATVSRTVQIESAPAGTASRNVATALGAFCAAAFAAVAASTRTKRRVLVLHVARCAHPFRRLRGPPLLAA